MSAHDSRPSVASGFVLGQDEPQMPLAEDQLMASVDADRDDHPFGHPELAVLRPPGKANPTCTPGAGIGDRRGLVP
jgi:hypothetical protein